MAYLEKPWLAHYEAGIPSTIEYPAYPLHQMLVESASKYGNRPAVKMLLRYLPAGITIGAELSYQQLDDATSRFASALHDLGVRKGDRVAVWLPNLPQFVIAFYGAMKLGAIVVNNNPQYTGREIKHQLVDSGAETIILLSPFYSRLKEIQRSTPVKHVIVADVSDLVGLPFKVMVDRQLNKSGMKIDIPYERGVYGFKQLLAHPRQLPLVEVDQHDPALFQYTGGTTGVPKAAMLTHHNMVANVIQISHWLPNLEVGREVMMGAIPFFHVYGMTVSMCLAMYVGGKLVIVPDPRHLNHVMEVIQREKATVFPGVPAMYIGIINHPDVRQYNLHSVKACISGAAPLPMEVQEQFGEITGGRLVEGYGLTEAAPVTHCNPVYGLRKSGSIGIPLPDVEARIVSLEPDENGAVHDMPLGEAGELALRGPQVMAGYYKQPDETAKTRDADGWLYTGDIARMDEDGYFYIVDRKKDLIIASGYNIVPREVEEVLFMHPKVLEAVVAGIPDARRGETVKAYVVLKPGEAATAEEIITFCRQNLAAYKTPTAVEFRSELPKTMVGKFLRRVLREEEIQKMREAGKGDAA